MGNAHMIPSEIGYYEIASRENEMFDALSNLSSDYYVFHSYRVNQIVNGMMNESETDFLIFHPDYGCLFIEAKNGHVTRDDSGQWYYQSGDKMKDPFDQACTNMYAVVKKITEISEGKPCNDYIKKCKFLFCVWFPAYYESQINNANFGPNVIKDMILPKEALNDPTKYIERIMKKIQKLHVVIKEPEIIEDGKSYSHGLTRDESFDLFKNALCPSFDIVPGMRKKYFEDTYDKLLDEQCVVLDFLANQKSAAISGSSGTGKTYVALERAKRLSEKGDKVLFLCYNKNLKEFLETKRAMANVDYFTIDGYACKMLKSSSADYYTLQSLIEEQILSDTFEYKHIIIDEGQDFGKPEIDDSKILDTLAEYANSTNGCSFFIFYDKNQLVNSKNIPSYLVNVDSKLTLYKNCRNTKSIAETAFSLIDVNPILIKGAMEGDKTMFIFYENVDELEKRIDNVIENISKENEFGRVLITCKSLANNSLTFKTDSKTMAYKSLSGKKTTVYSCSTFKGLEEDFVLLFDVTADSFKKDDLSFYVGASRAKKKLFVFINLNDIELSNVLESRFPSAFKIANKKQQLSLAMHGIWGK